MSSEPASDNVSKEFLTPLLNTIGKPHNCGLHLIAADRIVKHPDERIQLQAEAFSSISFQ
jgi:hypothetical protein